MAERAQSISPSVRHLDGDSLVQSIGWMCRAQGVVANVTALPLRTANDDHKAFAAELRADIERALIR